MADALSPFDRALIAATEAGLPLVADPWGAVAARIGAPREAVVARLRELLAGGAIRRIGLVPNHYALGLVANGMAVFDVDDAAVGRVGRMVGALPFVTHCYRRPRRPPAWPYNLFAMVHGASREEVEAKRAEVAAVLGTAARGGDILYSTRILKKTGLRIAG